MTYTEIFPVTLGTLDLSDQISNDQIESWKKILQNEKFQNIVSVRDHLTVNEQILNLDDFKVLKKIILEKSKIFCKKINFEVEDVQIASSWGYLIQSNNALNNWHIHKNSVLSGVYYLTEGADIMFHDPKEELYDLAPRISKDTFERSIFKIKPKKNNLIIFPSYLSHAVDHNKDLLRISLPFNIIPKGKFGPSNALIFFK